MTRIEDLTEVAKFIETGTCKVDKGIDIAEDIKPKEIKKVKSGKRKNFWKQKEKEDSMAERIKIKTIATYEGHNVKNKSVDISFKKSNMMNCRYITLVQFLNENVRVVIKQPDTPPIELGTFLIKDIHIDHEVKAKSNLNSMTDQCEVRNAQASGTNHSKSCLMLKWKRRKMKMPEFNELAKAKIQESRNLVISKMLGSESFTIASAGCHKRRE